MRLMTNALAPTFSTKSAGAYWEIADIHRHHITRGGGQCLRAFEIRARSIVYASM